MDWDVESQTSVQQIDARKYNQMIDQHSKYV